MSKQITKQSKLRGRNQSRRRTGANPSPLAPPTPQAAPKTRVDKVDSHAGKARRDWKTKFLLALRKEGNVSAACRRAKISREHAYNERETRGKVDAALAEAIEFAALWDSALETALDDLEAEARRRAMVGVKRKKFTRTGEPIQDPATGQQYVEYEMSDALMQFLLRVHRYGDKHQHEITGAGGGPVQVTDYATMDDGDLDAEIDKLITKRRAHADRALALGGIVAGTGSAAERPTAGTDS